MQSDRGLLMLDIENLDKWLQCHLIPQRFGPIDLWLRDGSRLKVLRPDDMQVRVDDNTVAIATADGWRQVLLEDVLSLGLRPRVQPATESRM